MTDIETKLRVRLEAWEAGEGTMDELVKYILELTGPTPDTPERETANHVEASLAGIV